MNRIVVILGVIIAGIFLIFISPIFNDIQQSFAPYVSNITSTMPASFTVNGTVIYTQGVLQGQVVLFIPLIIVGLIVVYLIYTAMQHIKGQEEVE
jgi:hypothetical protein